jgi:hypothetical protein
MKYKDRNVKVLKELGLYDAFKVDFQFDKMECEQEDMVQSFILILGYASMSDIINNGCTWSTCHTRSNWNSVYEIFRSSENGMQYSKVDSNVIVEDFKSIFKRKYDREWTTESVTRRF